MNFSRISYQVGNPLIREKSVISFPMSKVGQKIIPVDIKDIVKKGVPSFIRNSNDSEKKFERIA